MNQHRTPLDEWVLPGVRWRSWQGDVVVALATPLLGLLTLVTGLYQPDPARPWGTSVGALALFAASSVPLLLKRRTPMIAIILAFALALLSIVMVSRHTVGLATFVLIFDVVAAAIVTVGAGRRRRVVIVGLTGALLLGYASLPLDATPLTAPLSYTAFITLVGLALMWGFSVSQRDDLVRIERERADAVEKVATIRREDAIRADRAAVAAELHDEIAARLTAISLQSGALVARAGSTPMAEPARAIRAASGEAIAELQQLIRILAADRAEPVSSKLNEAHRQVDVASSLNAAADAFDLELTTRGTTGNLSADIAESLSFIGREAIANAARHATGHPVVATLARTATHVRISVRNETGTPDHRSAGTGLGLGFMRDRWLAHGGTGTVGRTDDGEWLVSAEIPVTS